MKRRRKVGKRILALLLAFVLVLSPIPGDIVRTAADTTEGQEEYVTDVTGLRDWGRVRLEKSVTVNEDTNIHEEVILESGAAIYVTSGRLVVNSEAVVNGDIYLESRAVIEIYGTVLGTVHINSTQAAEAREDYDGNMVRPNNFYTGGGSYVENVILNGKGFGYLDGNIGTLEITENSDGDFGTGTDSEIGTINYHGTSVFGSSSKIGTVNVDADGTFEIYYPGEVDFIRVSRGAFSNGGTVHFAMLDGAGQINNWNQGDPLNTPQESLIENLLLTENVQPYFRDGEQCRNLENCGNIGNIVAYGGTMCLLGDTDYVYAENCDCIYVETCSWRYDWGTDYQVEYLYAKNSRVSCNDYTDDGSQAPRIKTARIEGGCLEGYKVIIEDLYLTGSFSTVILGNVNVYSLYMDTIDITNQPYIEIWNEEQVGIGSFTVSTAAEAGFRVLAQKLLEQYGEKEEQEAVIEKMVTVADMTHSGSELTTKGFAKELNQYDIVTVSFAAAEVLGAVIVTTPSGYESVVMSKDSPQAASFLAYEPGVYSFRVVGDSYGAELGVDVAASAVLEVEMYTQTSAEIEDEAPKRPDRLSSYRVWMHDVTTDREFTGFTIVGDKIYFREDPQGHSFDITFYSVTNNWQYEESVVQTSLNGGEAKKLTVVMKQFGEYYGYTKDGVIPQVYLYNAADGVFLRSMDTDSYGNFWSGWMPSGHYTAVFIQDPTGSFMFKHLEEFEEYGLVDKEDYIKDTFEIKAGLCTTYKNVPVPEAPTLENLYFDTEVTAFNTNRQTTVVGELIQLTLDYAFREEYAKKVSGILFRFPLSEECEVKEESVTLNGKVVDCTLEDNTLVVPVEETLGTICFQMEATENDVTLVTNALADFILKGEEVTQFLGTTSTNITALSLTVPSISASEVIYATGYTNPGEEVTILDNGVVVATTFSNSSGYYSTKVVLVNRGEQNHMVSAAIRFGTTAELQTREQLVSISNMAPELLNFHMYYFVHGHSAEFDLTGEEFQSKRFIYDYWPGSVFTFEVKLSDSSQIDKMYIVSNNGGVKKLQAFYQPEEDIWVASGIFSEDENYAPADFDVEYTFRRIDIATEIGMDYDTRNETVDQNYIDAVYDAAEKEVTDAIFDEDTNTVSATVNVDTGIEGESYASNITMSYREAEHTAEELLASGYSCISEAGVDYYYKNEVNLETGKMVTSIIVLFPEGEESASASELTLFNTDDKSYGEQKLSEFQEIIETNIEDYIKDQLTNLGKDALELLADGNSEYAELAQAVLDGWELAEDVSEVIDDIGEVINDITGVVEEIKDWKDILTGKEANEARDAYFAKLDELERMVDEMARLQSEGKAGKCAFLPLGPYYDAINAAREGANEVFNAQWSMGMIRKICGGAAEYMAGSKFKIKGKDGKMVETSLDDLLKIPGIDTEGMGLVEKIGADIINNVIDDANEYLDVSNWFDKGMDLLEGDTLNYWEDANAKYLDQLTKNIEQLYGTPSDANLMGDMAKAGEKDFGIQMGGTAGGLGGCFDEPSEYPRGDFPGGGGVNWDPSGYVYEAVPSNRLAGVTAVTYYQDKDGNAVLWDAEEYGQINPQVTDAEGRYGWFVPEGNWKVVYTKDGYEVAETEWLPVPPPQTEVNVGLVSQAAPELAFAAVSPANAIVALSRYVTVDSVTTETLYVTTASGARLKAAVEAVDAEEDADGRMLASKFRIVLKDKAEIDSDYAVVLTDDVMGYNGIKAKESKLTCVCTPLPEGIEAETQDYVPIGGESTLRITVAADGGFDRMSLECTTDERFVEVVKVGSIGADGTAEIVLKGKKAGASNVTIRVAGSDVVLDKAVVTASEQDSSLLKYVELQKAQPAAATVPEEKESNFGWIIAVAALLLLAGGVVGVVIFKKRKNSNPQEK